MNPCLDLQTKKGQKKIKGTTKPLMANLVFWFLYLLLKAVCISSLCVCSWSSPGERDCADVASPSNRREGWSEEGSSAGSWGNYPTKHRQHLQRCELYIYIASFPASPLTLMKSKNGGGEPGIDSHVISWHNDVTAIITKVMTKLCAYLCILTGCVCDIRALSGPCTVSEEASPWLSNCPHPWPATLHHATLVCVTLQVASFLCTM